MPVSFNWKVVGAAGEGIKSTGMMFSKTMLRSGFATCDYTEYPSLIRGGHNTYQVLVSPSAVTSPALYLDQLIALNLNGLKLHAAELTKDSLTIFDGDDLHLSPDQITLPGHLLSVPLYALAKQAGGERLMANNVALGLTLGLLQMDLAGLNQVIADTFAGKDPAITLLNQKAAELGYQYAKTQCHAYASLRFAPQSPIHRHSLTGNEAISLGLLAGGLQAYVAYPMTPSSSILHSLADWQSQANILVKHAEDEIGVINMALGLSFAGARVAVGTSGGGFCYMTEAVGLAGVAELPLVIIESQRPGPALGMPTWTAQADLLMVIHSSQDEFPRIVLAPGDPLEAFELARQSLSWAETYHLPVILLSDKHLSESALSCTLPPGPFTVTRQSLAENPQVNDTGFYPRYQPTDTGLSLRSLPGTRDGYYCANSYEHDPQGLASESAADRISQVNKRFRKLDLIRSQIPAQFYDGPNHPRLTLLGFGSTKMALLGAAAILREEGFEVGVMNLSWLWPFPADQVTQKLDQSQNVLLIEGNHDYQLGQLIRTQTGRDIFHKRQKYDGRPFYPHEIVAWAKEVLQ